MSENCVTVCIFGNVRGNHDTSGVLAGEELHLKQEDLPLWEGPQFPLESHNT